MTQAAESIETLAVRRAPSQYRPEPNPKRIRMLERSCSSGLTRGQGPCRRPSSTVLVARASSRRSSAFLQPINGSRAHKDHEHRVRVSSEVEAEETPETAAAAAAAHEAPLPLPSEISDPRTARAVGCLVGGAAGAFWTTSS